MTAPLRITTVRDRDVDVAVFEGSVDERFDLVGWGSQQTYPLVIDLAGVEFINSEGVAMWILFLANAVERGPVIVRRASEPMVSLFNMVTDSVRGVTVESIRVGYLCLACTTQNLVDLDVKDLRTDPRSMPERPCLRCGGSMAFDGAVERYLAFLRPE